MRRKGKNLFIISFLAPAVLCFLFIFLYPTVRTMLMSLFHVEFVTDDMNSWTFVRFENFKTLFGSALFIRSMTNILKIWLVGGIVILLLATLLSVIITSGVKFKNFWRSLIYLPHIISVVALVTMWTQYAFNNQYGLFKTVFNTLGLTSLAAFQWTAPENLFLSMMIAYAYGSVGFYVLILVAGIDGISKDYYEAAEMEGANNIVKFFRITMPLLKDIFKRCIVLYSAGAMGFFAYSSLFSFSTELATVTPLVYMYDNVFGRASGNVTTPLNVGAGAAVGVMIMIMVLLVNLLLDRLMPSDVDILPKKKRIVRRSRDAN
jgi:ABC-type sugar transport system permease subunit